MFDYDEKPELNITPLVDIMLVLLAILMVATPAIIYEEKIQLPDGSKTQTSQTTKELMIVRITEDKQIHIDQSKMNFVEFADNLLLLANSGKYDKDKPVFIQADKKLLYDDVMFVLKTLKQTGYLKVALQTNG
ncbi:MULTISPECIES: ExbD/TolR family protein [unclassified Campylobacter]|uniref:ExbD/TolR family protein n=1 Tax=unclassified Campylobacter TaxID=2593542 RepID=UPI0022E9C0D0|nr:MULTISPECIES: biopolymer transporter ExbD [unclassified Campylobacter]MDA3055459.1 biopolymer transporter ExbD [Campylobacter sp. CN_NA1]MDA3064851.1 biopolymer transporter ExbD [Campylobacter sp. CN_NE4]MDA3068325.1 biopolymer transporter ExbD [Campylobacter sp. CN_NE3]MDA3082362.1 biopolymer transporter ExbD [Campylobacter sp. CN_EL2]MDA3083997.1 biopolymer transporter ExbD [Campylobacter sp. CN_NE1]